MRSALPRKVTLYTIPYRGRYQDNGLRGTH